MPRFSLLIINHHQRLRDEDVHLCHGLSFQIESREKAMHGQFNYMSSF